MAQELQVISDFYDLTFYLAGRTAKFPRHHRHSLGQDMEHPIDHALLKETFRRVIKDRRLLGLLDLIVDSSRIDWGVIQRRLASWVGHARQADSRRLLERLNGEWSFTRRKKIQNDDPREAPPGFEPG